MSITQLFVRNRCTEEEMNSLLDYLMRLRVIAVVNHIQKIKAELLLKEE